MFITDILNKVVLNTLNHSITLNNIIILLIAISTALIIEKMGTEFSFQNWYYIIIKMYLI